MAFVLLSSLATSQRLYLKWTNPINIAVINSKEDDFAPSWNNSAKELYFNSSRNGLSKFFKSILIDSVHFSKPEELKDELNMTDNNVSYITFLSEDRAYLSTFRLNSFRPFFNIHETVLTREGWSSPLQVNGFISDNNILHPTVSPDGTQLVAASDLNSTEHKTDLFISYINENGQWGELQPLHSLNTEGNEITPHFTSNDTLYLASDGQGGPGGFDLFYSIRLSDGSWTKPNPINELNTQYDESDLTSLPNNRAVFSSNRPGSKGGFDLYLTSHFLTEFKIAPERMLEISIATQILTLKTMDDFNYEFFPLVNAVFSNADDEILNSIFSESDKTEFSSDINEIYLQSFREIGRRFYNNPNAELIIHYNILETDDKNIKLPDSESIAKRAERYFSETWKVPSDKIRLEKHLKKLSGAELTAYPMIYLESDNPMIFEYLEIGKREIEIDPPFSDIFVKIKPKENLINWTTELSTNVSNTDFFRVSDLASDQFSISLKDFATEIKMADSLIITVNAVNKFSDTISKKLFFDLTHSEMKKRKVRIINGRNFEQLYVFVPSEEPGSESNYIKNISRVIAEGAEFSKSVTLQFFSASGQKRALSYAEYLKDVIDNQYLEFNIEQTAFSSDEPFDRTFAPFMIRVLLEKM